MNYYISDLHLFCKNELKNGYFKERPFETLEEMHETILKTGIVQSQIEIMFIFWVIIL